MFPWIRACIVIACCLVGGGGADGVLAQSIEVMEAQESLRALGMDPGPVDGFMGPRTREAIREFQRDRGLPITGDLDKNTLSALAGDALPVEEAPIAAQPSRLEVPIEQTSPSDARRAPTMGPGSERGAEASTGTERLQTTAPSPVSPIAAPAEVPQPSVLPQQGAASFSWLYWAAAFAALLLLWLRSRRRRARSVAVAGGGSPAEEDVPVEPGTNRFREADAGSGLNAFGERFDDEHVPGLGAVEPHGGPSEAGASAGVPHGAASSSAAQGAARQAGGDSLPSARQRHEELLARTGSTSDTRPRWIPAGERVVVAGRNIGGMVYVGRAPQVGRPGQPDNAFIDPLKPVASRGDDFAASGMPYWPCYSLIPPRSRATYLDWLASGRADKRYNVGYVFLYFYGLERRFFVDQPDGEEKQAIVAEVRRLLSVYGENNSVQRYLGAFCDAASLLMLDGKEPEPVYEKTGFELPMTVRLAIGAKILAGESVPAEWVLSWLCTHPETWLRTPAKRAFPEFKALFEIRFKERYPEGLKVTKPRKTLSISYRAASDTFTGTFTSSSGDIPDIAGLSKPLDIAMEIADGACDELDKFSRYLGRNPDGRGTVEAHGLLPEPLKPLFPCPELDRLRAWVDERLAAGGQVPVIELIERLEGSRPERVGKRELTGAADALCNLGIGMAPDPRFALRAPKIDEPVVLFPLPGGTTRLENVNDGYRAALLAVTLSSFIAHADGNVSELERQHLEERIEREPSLTPSERKRLRANLMWMMAIPPDLGLLRRRLKDTSQDVREALGPVALAIAGADGHIDPAEINAIQKLYSALGLPSDGIYSELHALTAASEPVTVFQPSTTGQEFAIPPPPAPKTAPAHVVELDHDRIAAIMSDTARVSGVLHAIFADEEEEADQLAAEAEAASDAETDGRFSGLDAKHRTLVEELLRAEAWSEEQFDRLASQCGLMAAGALEAINEWSFERFDEPLLEEDGDLSVNPEVAAQLAA